MYSSQLSQGDGEGDYWTNFQETSQDQCLPPPLDLRSQYEYFTKNSVPFINLNQVTEKVLKHHRITITHNTNISKIFNVYEKDCYITIKKRQHYGTHCIYDVVLANFTLEIHLLNLHRSSDDHDSALSQAQLGKGGFGSVRIVKAGNNTMAVKRINFLKKAQGVNGFDIETQNAQCKQIHKAIREYCLYKISSMLKIGPEVIFNSNYDLVCFNNCIQFIMELCELPSKRPNVMMEKGLYVQKMKKDLFENMDLMHRLNIVHRDIKPDNILYSESLKRFVFTDFGITHAVTQKYHEKTLTSFAGTPQYCTEQMKELLSKGQGPVNLYLNDFYGLKKSIQQFQAKQYKSSEMSHNAMSYRSQSANSISFVKNQLFSYQAPASFQQWFKSDVSEGSQMGSSNIYISSINSLDAPMKYASQINFFQAIILYEIFENHQERIGDLTPDIINKVINKYTDQISSAFAENEIKRYVLGLFYPSQSSSIITLKIIDLKNTARNFGPKHEETLQKIDEILALPLLTQKSEIHEYFKNLKQSVITNPQSLEIGKFAKQMMIHLYLKNYNYFIGCSIRIMRENVRLINKIDLTTYNDPFGLKMTRTLICKIYIICQRLNVLTIHQNKIINDLFIKVWKYEQIADLMKDLSEIHDELSAYNKNSHYNFAHSPSNSRIVARLMKFAVDYVMNSDHMSSFEILQAFNFFIYRFNWTNSTDYQFYYAFINKLEVIQQEKEISANKISLKVEMVKVYRKICRLQNHKQLNKAQYITRAKKITESLKKLQDKKYYFTCVTQLIWIYFENRQFNNLTLQTAFLTLKQLQIYSCPDIQKYDSLIQINNIIGDLYNVQEQYDNALIYLRNAERYIVSVYGSQNLMQSYFQCILNISLTLYRQNKLQSALASYNEVLFYLQRTKKVVCYEKSFIYRSIIVIKLQMGIKKEQYPEIDTLIKNIVYETIFTIISLTTSQFQLQNYILDLSIFSFIHIPKEIHQKIFVLKALLRYLENNLKYFTIPYDKINYLLNKIYTNDLKQPSKGLTYVWNYIKVKLRDFHNVTVEDFKLMNDFVGRLIRNNSSRRALIIIRKYIFHIPLDLFKQRQNAFKLYHKVHANLGHPLEKVLYQLTVKDCQGLYNKNFSKIYREQTTHEAKMKNILLKKWLHRV